MIKKILNTSKFYLILLITLQILTGCGGSDSSNNSSSPTKLTDELKYFDDTNGMYASPWGDGSSSHNPKVGVYFDFTNHYATIKAVKLYLRNYSGTTQKYNVVVYKYNDQSFKYDKNVSSSYDNSISNNKIQAQTVDIPDIEVNNEKVFVTLEW